MTTTNDNFRMTNGGAGAPHSSFVFSALTIAASDPTGGAGIQVDLRTFGRFGVPGLSVITAVTSQNSLGVSGVWPVPAEAIESQLNGLLLDHSFTVVKIGALASREAVRIVTEFLSTGKYEVILDPVINPTRGIALTDSDAVQAMREALFPLVTMLTPNIPEAELLLGRKIESFKEMSRAARDLQAMGAESILLKGGHLTTGDVVRDLYLDSAEHWFESPRVDAELHGSGCILSSAIAACRARGEDTLTAIQHARDHMRQRFLHQHQQLQVF